MPIFNTLADQLKQKPLSAAFLAVVTLVLLVSFSYQPALHGPFVFDDQINILENPDVKVEALTWDALQTAMLSNESGAFKRILPALSFGLNHFQAQGFTNTYPFKLTNLCVHLLNTLLVFCLMLQLVPRLLVAGVVLNKPQTLLLAYFVALLWAAHPLHVSTVAYVVQRMTSMAAVFMLLGLNGYVYARNRFEAGQRWAVVWMLTALVLGAALGLLCKENAVLIVLYAAVIEYCLYGDSAQRKTIGWLYGCLLGIPLMVGAYVVLSGQYNLLAGYFTRPFTLEERLLTEARVLWLYVQMLVFPDIRVMSLYHDDIPLSKNWLEPISTLVSVVAWGSMLLLALLGKRRWPVFSFAVLWFLAGHTMESTVLPLEIAFEHRNYLPAIGVVLLLVVSVVRFAHRLSATHFQWFALPGLLLLSVLLLSLTVQRSGYWQSEASLFKSMATQHPESPISVYSYAELLNKKENEPAAAYAYYLKAVALNKESAGLLMQATLAAPISAAPDPLLEAKHLQTLLNKRLLPPFDVTVLDDASHCVVSKFGHCADHVQDVLGWLTAAIDNDFVNQDWRRTYVKSKFTIEMQYGFYEQALQTVTKAQTQDPRVFQYYLMKADALGATGQIQAALALVNTAEQLAQRYNPLLLTDVNRLRSKLSQP